MRKAFLTVVAVAALSLSAKGQTNIQTFYDFGSDRNYVTTTVEGFYNDNWGSTFFFIDHDYASKNADGHVYAPSGTYWEIARCLNFWHDSALAPLSLHVEYNGGVYNDYTINNAFLAGIDYSIHDSNFSKTLNLKVLYKNIDYNGSGFSSQVPLQFTAVWGIQDLFDIKGLRFCGFADFWWEDHYLHKDHSGVLIPEISHTVFITEPQLWYNVGQHFGCDKLNIGGEVEISYDFATSRGLWVRPCAGLKWVF